MGNSPSSGSTSTDDEQDERTIHPDQTTVDETTESDDDESATEGGGPSVGATAESAGGSTAGSSPTAPKTDDPDPDEEEESEQRDEQLPEEEPDDTNDQDSEEFEDSDDKDDEEDDAEADLIVYTDPWDTTGWVNEPELRDLEVTYPQSLSIRYEVLPPRTVDMVDRDHDMPVDSGIELPETTETSYRALRAADKQGGLRPYLRRLRIAALSEGRNIENEEVLLDLATEVGLDAAQIETDMDQINIPTGDETTPRITGIVGSEPHRWSGRIEAKRFKVRFVGEGIEPDLADLPPSDLVDRHEPVSSVELRAAYGEVPTAALTHVELGGDEYWNTT